MTQSPHSTSFYHNDLDSDLLETFAGRGKSQLETLRLSKHVRVNAEHYANAMCDEAGQLRSDCFLLTDEKAHAAFTEKHKEIGELGINVQLTPALVLKHVIQAEPHESALLSGIYHQAKLYGTDKPLERINPVQTLKSNYTNTERPLAGQPQLFANSPELMGRHQKAHEILARDFTDEHGGLKPKGFFAEPKWQTKIEEVRQKIASDQGLLRPVSTMHATRHLLDDADPTVGHELREALIRHEKLAKPVLGPHTKRHVTDDPAVLNRIHGDSASR